MFNTIYKNVYIFLILDILMSLIIKNRNSSNLKDMIINVNKS